MHDGHDAVARDLRNLLAVIHGDDGEHTERVGLAASCSDAEVRVGSLRHALDLAVQMIETRGLRSRSDIWREIVERSGLAESDRERCDPDAPVGF